MSSGRAFTFIALSSLIMLGGLFLQGLFSANPDVPAGESPAPESTSTELADNEDNNGGVSLMADASPQSDAPTISPPENSSESADVDSAKDLDGQEPKTDRAAETDDRPVAGDTEEAGAVDQANSSPKATAPAPAFIKLGSLAQDGSDRYLITINQNGGTLHRIELNYRDPDGSFRYRDFVHVGGYLGSINTVDANGQITVLAVGSQTPADLAGLKKSDVIESFNGDALVGREDLDAWLANKTKIGDTIQIGIRRRGQAQTLTATLSAVPVSLVQPEGDLVDPAFDYPESFVFSLIKPGPVHIRWPDIDPGMREGRWEVTDRSTNSLVELKFDIPADRLQQLELPGPLTVFKRFRLPALTEDDIQQLDSRTFHIELEIEIVNGSDQSLDLAYELDGPTGTSAETWWYANKIHGRQTALFYTAGSRDVVGGTASNSYVFWGRPEIVDGAKSSSPTPKRICDPISTELDDRRLRFAGVDSHYFNVSLIPRVPAGEFLDVDSVEAYPNNRQGVLPEFPKSAALQKLIDVTFQMVVSTEIPAGQSYRQTYDVFAGPKEPVVLAHYELTDTRTFGWFGWCSIVLLQILHFFYTITFQYSYGLAIIMLTVLVRCIMIPFSRKAALNAQMMQYLSPQVKEINEKYGTDLEKKTKATQELYKKYKFNPLGGCFMMFFQLPIFYGLYKALNVDIALRDQPFIPGLQWCRNLAAPDQLLNWQSWMPAWLGDETGYLGPYLNILPILTMVLFILQQKLFTPPATDDQQKMMQKMMMFMMVFMGFMFFKVPSGLCLYFITSSLWAVIERKLLPKPKLDTDGLEQMDSDTSAKKTLLPGITSKWKQKVAPPVAPVADERRKRNSARKKRLQNRQDKKRDDA